MPAGEGLGIATGQQHRKPRVTLVDGFGQSQSVKFAWQHHVGEHQIDCRAGGEKVQCRLGIFDGNAPVVELLEQCHCDGLHIRIVFDDQDGLTTAGGLTGRRGVSRDNRSVAAGQIESRLRSVADLAANTDGATRLLRETKGLREAKTGSLVGTLGGEERLENPRQNFRRDAEPRIADRNRYELALSGAMMLKLSPMMPTLPMRASAGDTTLTAATAAMRASLALLIIILLLYEAAQKRGLLLLLHLRALRQAADAACRVDIFTSGSSRPCQYSLRILTGTDVLPVP